MSARLITQVAESALEVALIGPATPLVAEIDHYCQRQGFTVQHFPLADTPTLEEALKDKDWYKVILVAEVTPAFKLDVFQAVWAEWCRVPERQRVVVITLPTLIDSAMPEYHSWATVSSWAEELVHQAAGATASVFIGQDVITGDEWLPLQTMRGGQSQGKLYNPGVTVTPQTYQDFWNTCKPHFFNPQPQTYLVTGMAYPTESIVREFQRQAQALTSSPLLQVTALPAAARPWPFTASQSLVNEAAALPDLLQPLVSIHPTALPQSPELPRPALRQPKKTVVLKTTTERMPTREIAAQKPPVKVTPPPPVVTDESTTDQELVEKVHAVFSEQRSQEKLESVKAIAQAQTQATGKKKHRQWLFYTACVFVGLGGLTITASFFYVFSAWIVRQNIWRALAPFEQENPEISPLSQNFVRQSISLTQQTGMYSVVVPSALLGSAPTWAELSSKMVMVHGEYQNFSQQLGEHIAVVLNPTSLVSPTPLHINERSQTVTTLIALLEQVEQLSLSADHQQLIGNYKSWLKEHLNELVAYQRLQPVLSQIVGSEQRRKYAIVFQNDQELRPTGGFIQSVAIITFANGQLIDTQTYGVYNLDTQLKAQVTPPTEVTQLLGEKNWFLRDSNWNPDFPKAAENMKWFLEHETNQPLDGVITLTGPALAGVLEAIGPIELPEYNEVITDRNLSERLEFHSEVQLTDQAEGKDYAEVLLQRTLQKAQNLSPEKGQVLAEALQEQLQQKNMLVYFKDSGEQSTIQALGWSGKLLLPDCPSLLSSGGKCLVDTLAVVDANIGVNKANYHLQRSETHAVSLSETQATHTHTLTFNNTSQSNAWPQGTYSAYTRFYVPANAEIKEVRLNDQVVSADKLLKGTYDIFQVVGVVSQTAIQQQSVLTVTYVTPLPQETKWAYAFFYQKQAGVPLTLKSVEFSHSPALTPKVIAPQAQVQLGTIRFTELEDDHVFVGASF